LGFYFGFPRRFVNFFSVCLVFQHFDLWQAAVENGLGVFRGAFPQELLVWPIAEVFEPTNWMWTMDGLLSAMLVQILNWWADIKADLFVGCKGNQFK